MNELQQHIDKIEAEYKENLWKLSVGIWSLQQWYEYCAVTLCDLMNVHDKQSKRAWPVHLQPLRFSHDCY